MRILSKRQLKELVPYSPQHVARLEKAVQNFASHKSSAFMMGRNNAAEMLQTTVDMTETLFSRVRSTSRAK